VEDDEDGTFAIVESTRPKLVGVTLRTVNGMAEVKVELLTGDKIIEGIAQGPSSAHNKLRLFVEATLKALSPLTLDKFLFVTEDVGITQLAKQQIALVSITLITSAGEQSLTGCTHSPWVSIGFALQKLGFAWTFPSLHPTFSFSPFFPTLCRHAGKLSQYS